MGRCVFSFPAPRFLKSEQIDFSYFPYYRIQSVTKIKALVKAKSSCAKFHLAIDMTRVDELAHMLKQGWATFGAASAIAAIKKDMLQTDKKKLRAEMLSIEEHMSKAFDQLGEERGLIDFPFTIFPEILCQSCESSKVGDTIRATLIPKK